MAATCVDATQEELFHAITQYGYANAYKKIFGELPPTLNSKIQLAMDKARYEWVLCRESKRSDENSEIFNLTCT